MTEIKKNVFCPCQNVCADDCFGENPCSYETAIQKLMEKVEELQEENRRLKEENENLKKK